MFLLFSHLVTSNSLQPMTAAWQASLPSPSPRVFPGSCSLHLWGHPAISSSDALFSFCPQSFSVSGAFPTSHLFLSDDQDTGASASASVLPITIQGWSPLRLTGSSIKTCILSRVKQITRPDWMHETSARAWCTGKTQRERVERMVGGGIGMGNTCKSMADSCQCMAKTTTIL